MEAPQTTNKAYWVLAGILLLAAFLHSGTAIKGGLYADDYLHQALFQGNAALAEKGVLDGLNAGSFWGTLSQQFNFFDPKTENYQALKDLGILPWWTADDALLHFFRPMATATHWLDYKLWPNNSHMMHWVNLLWYVLGLLAVFYFYKSVKLPSATALFALLLVVLDNSMFQVVSWVAARSMLMLIVFGFFAVAAYSKGEHSRVWYGISLLSFIVALLCAEGSVVIACFLGAYAFTLDGRSIGKRALALLPFALAVVVWRLLYQNAGFGALGVEFYTDPARDLPAFLNLAVYRLPGNFFELFSSIDIMSGQVRPDIRQFWFAALGLGILALLVFTLWQPLKNNKQLKFFLLATLFALVPSVTIALTPRVLVLPFISFAVVLAILFAAICQKQFTGVKKGLAHSFNGFTVLVHIALGLALSIFMFYNSADLGNKKLLERGGVQLGVENYTNKNIVVLNSNRPFWLSFVAHELALQDKPLFAHIRVLNSAFFAMDVYRVGEQTLKLTSKPGFQLDPKPLMNLQQHEHGHYAYLTQELLGLVRAEDTPWQQGAVYNFPELIITVDKLCQEKPCQITVSLKEPLEHYGFSYWDFEREAYQSFELPKIGESKTLEGIF